MVEYGATAALLSPRDRRVPSGGLEYGGPPLRGTMRPVRHHRAGRAAPDHGKHHGRSTIDFYTMTACHCIRLLSSLSSRIPTAACAVPVARITPLQVNEGAFFNVELGSGKPHPRGSRTREVAFGSAPAVYWPRPAISSSIILARPVASKGLVSTGLCRR